MKYFCAISLSPFDPLSAAHGKLTAERRRLNQEYISLKDEIKEVGQVRCGVYDIMRKENRRMRPTWAQDDE